MTMRSLTRWTRLLVVAGVFGSAGCNTLSITNPNAPDADRAFSDPDAIAGLVTGGFRNWMLTHESYGGSLLLSTMADAHTASWNNFNIRYYSSYGVECAERCGWDNVITSPFRIEIMTFWYGYYSVLSSANDVLRATTDVGLGGNGVIIGDTENTSMIKFGALMLQAMSHAELALNYDQGFVVDWDTDVTALTLEPASVLRDFAVAKFEEAIDTALGSTWTDTPVEWTGVTSGTSYTKDEMIQLARTMQARLLAYFPRTAAENAAVDWNQVATYAADGIDFDWEFFQDFNILFSGLKNWSNDLTTMRVDTRLSSIIPGSNQAHPWNGTPVQPSSTDNRLGNGTWGPTNDFLGGYGTIAGPSKDFAYSPVAIFLPARGQFHQSFIGHVRYSFTAYPGYGLPTEDGTGHFPVFTKTLNDLLRAEGALRGAGGAGVAAPFINASRVTRGGLPASAGTLADLAYEQDIELLAIGASPFYNRRRTDVLHTDTPREMPVPVQDLLILQIPAYGWGGPGRNDCTTCASRLDGTRVKSVHQLWREVYNNERGVLRTRGGRQ